jgi:hypothetical protein
MFSRFCPRHGPVDLDKTRAGRLPRRGGREDTYRLRRVAVDREQDGVKVGS